MQNHCDNLKIQLDAKIKEIDELIKNNANSKNQILQVQEELEHFYTTTKSLKEINEKQKTLLYKSLTIINKILPKKIRKNTKSYIGKNELNLLLKSGT